MRPGVSWGAGGRSGLGLETKEPLEPIDHAALVRIVIDCLEDIEAVSDRVHRADAELSRAARHSPFVVSPDEDRAGP